MVSQQSFLHFAATLLLVRAGLCHYMLECHLGAYDMHHYAGDAAGVCTCLRIYRSLEALSIKLPEVSRAQELLQLASHKGIRICTTILHWLVQGNATVYSSSVSHKSSASTASTARNCQHQHVSLCAPGCSCNHTHLKNMPCGPVPSHIMLDTAYNISHNTVLQYPPG